MHPVVSRILGTALAVGIASATFAQDEPRRNIRFGALPIPKVISALESEYGVRVKAIGSVKKDVIFLSLNEASFADVRTEISKILNATWTDEDGIWVLNRSLKTENQEREALVQVEAKEFSDLFKKVLQTYSKTPEFTLDEAKKLADSFRGPQGGITIDAEVMKLVPGRKSVVQVLQMISPTTLAKIPYGARVVFATNPTALQRPLSLSALQIAQSLVNESQILQTVLDQEFGPSKNPLETIPVGTRSVVREAFLVIERDVENGSLSAKLSAINSEGEAISGGEFSNSSSTHAPKYVPIDLADLTPLEFSKYKEFDEALGRAAGLIGDRQLYSIQVGDVVITNEGVINDFSTHLSPELLTAFRSPDKLEPLNLKIGPLLQQVAEKNNFNISAWLPDGLIVGGVFMDQLKVKNSQDLFKFLHEYGGQSVTQDYQTIRITARKEVIARQNRVDRNALTALIRTAKANGGASLMDQAIYAVTSPVASYFGFDRIYGGMVCPEARLNVLTYDESQRSLFRLFGHLSPNQKTDALSGQAISYLGMPANAKAIYEQMILGSSEGPKRSRRVQIERENGTFLQYGIGGQKLEKRSERTYILASGIPAPAHLSLTADVEKAVLAEMTDGTIQPMNAGQIALTNIVAEGHNLGFSIMGPGEKQSEMPMMKRGKLMNQSQFRFDLVLLENYLYSGTLNVPLPAARTGFIPLEEFPEDFQESIRKLEDEYRRKYPKE